MTLEHDQRAARSRRQREWRQRRRQGIGLLTVPVDIDRLADCMIVTGRLTCDEALQRAPTQRALSQLLSDWCSEVEDAGRV